MGDEFEIEQNIPLIIRRHGFAKAFQEMKVGDSFFVSCPADRISQGRVQGSVSSAAKHFARNGNGFKIATRKVNNFNGETGLRVWRIA